MKHKVAYLFLPIVFVLTKIGEGTVKSLLFFIQLASRFSLPKKSFPLKRKKTYRSIRSSIIIYAIPFQFKIRYVFLGLFLAALLFIPFIIRVLISELPNPNQLTYREVSQSSKLYDRNGKLLFEFYSTQNRSKVTLSDIPKSLVDATIAIEDKNFYHHKGADLEAILRAFHETLVNKNLQGGSTITQQLIKTALLTPDVTLNRKIKEVFLAFWAERLYTKDQILEMYFNQVPYGGTAWGVEAAAETYFGKNVKDLDLAESALLAGLPSGPSIYSPFGPSPSLGKERQKEVLSRMTTLGFITKDQENSAYAENLNFASPIVDIRAPHFVMYVKDFLVRRFGIRAVEQGGLRVTTSLDLSLQDQAQQIVRDEIEKLKPLSVTNGAALITNPQTGEILAMIGSKNYFDLDHDGNVNVTTSIRQPGSSIKLITYAAALEKGITAATLLDDSPITYQSPGGSSYSPVNYDGKFHGKVTLRQAFGNSYNVPAVKTLAFIGMPAMFEMARRLGITTWNDEGRFGLSLTLGGGEIKMTDLATAYGTVATGGVRHDLTPIIKITDSEGQTLYDTNAMTGRRVLTEGIAFILSDILADNNARSSAFGPTSVLNIPNVSVKTGTTDSKRDNWTIGFTKNLLVAVWVGNNDNSPMNPALVSGITGAAPIWNKLITTVISAKAKELASQPTVKPNEVVAVPVCSINGLLPCGGCPTKTEYFVDGTQPQLACRTELLPPPNATGGAEPASTNH